MTMSKQRTSKIHPITRLRAKHLRQPQTLAEQKLWDMLRSRRLAGYKFRRQHPIGKYIVDFYCPFTNLIIEVDGESHDKPRQAEYDSARTEWLESQGYHMLRVRNEDVFGNLEGGAEEILAKIEKLIKDD